MTPYPGTVSVVLPAFNEEAGIEAAISAVCEYFDDRADDLEIVVSDDGSTDGTRAAVEARQRRDGRLKLVGGGVNRGKGHAVRQGILASRGDIVLFLDVDLSTPVEMMDRVWPELETGADVVVGARRIKGAEIEVHQPAIREALGDVFRRSARWLLNLPVSDITCGFKAFDGPSARRLFATLEIDDWSFDLELLVAASQAGLRVCQIPVVWRDDPTTKVRLHRDIPLAAIGVVRVFLKKARGRWKGLEAHAPE